MEPLPVIPLDYAPQPAQSDRRWRAIMRWSLLSGCICCITAWSLIPRITESVLVSGPVILAIGVIILAGGIRARSPLTTIIGAGHCGICLLFFGLVVTLGWGPDAAEQPFFIMGLIYWPIATMLTWRAMPRWRLTNNI